MLDNTANNCQKKQDTVAQFNQLSFGSTPRQLIDGLSFEGIEKAPLATLERVFTLTLDSRKANDTFLELIRHFLATPGNDQIETQKRIVFAATNVVEDLTHDISLRLQPRIQLLMNSVEMIIHSLSVAGTVYQVDEFSQLTEAYFLLAKALHLTPARSGKFEDIQKRMVQSLAQSIVPALVAVEELPQTTRDRLAQVVHVYMQQHDLVQDVTKLTREMKEYWCDVLYLARQSSAGSLQPTLFNVCESLWDYSITETSFSKKRSAQHLLSHAVASLSVSGINEQSMRLFAAILEKENRGTTLYYQTFMGLSIASLSLSWKYLRSVSEDALAQNLLAQDVLLDYLALPGAARALMVEFSFIKNKQLIFDLSSRYQDEIYIHDFELNERKLSHNSQRNSRYKFSPQQIQALATVFSDYGWNL